LRNGKICWEADELPASHRWPHAIAWSEIRSEHQMKVMPAACVTLAILFATLPARGVAQVGVGIRVGLADGTTGWVVGEVNGRAPIADRVVATAVVQGGFVPGPCEDSWPQSYRCGFSGWGIAAGPALKLLEIGRLNVDAGGTVGVFTRTGDGFGDERSVSWSIGADAALRLGSRFGLQAGVHHRRVRDKQYRELFGGDVRMTAITTGVLVQF